MNLNQLATLFRPTKFSEVVGHSLSVRALQGMVGTKNLPTGLLLSGASGAGKTTLARIVAAELDADVVEVDAASHGGVAEVRKLTDGLRYSSGRPYKVLIIDEAHSLTRDAFNALLKTLEEPADGILFILVTTDPHKLPKTIRTRLIEFDFQPLTPTEIATRMVQVIRETGMVVSPEIVKHIATNSEGSARNALTDLGLCATSGIETIEEYMQLTGDSDVSVELLQAMESQDLSEAYSIVEYALGSVSGPSIIVGQLITSLRDLMVIRAGDKSGLVREQLEEKKDLARTLIPERVFAMLRILWDLKTQIRTRGDSRQDLELAVALLYDVMNKGRETAPREVKTVERPKVREDRELTLEEIENLGIN